MGIKANYAPMVYCHGVSGKAASKHGRPEWVTAERDDDAVADLSGQWREHSRQPHARADTVGLGHAAEELEVHEIIRLERSSLQK